jgi:hypothetical protein
VKRIIETEYIPLLQENLISIVNIQQGKRVVVGKISGDNVNFLSDIIYPGRTTEKPPNSNVWISYSH